MIWNKGSNYSNEDFFDLLIDANLQNDLFKNYFQHAVSDDIISCKDPDLFLDQNNNVAVSENVIEDISNSLAVFILIELDWSIEEDLGISIIQKLRIANVKVPVFFCSFHNEEYFKEKKADIIYFNGHYFINLPNDWESQTDAIESLDDMELADVQFHFCDIPGFIRTIWHKKQQAGSMSFNSGKIFIKELLNEIREIGSIPDVIKDETFKIESEIENINETSFSTFLDENTERRFLNLIDETKDEENHRYSGGWEVLILEDNRQDVQDLENKLKQIDENLLVHIAESYNKAIAIIKGDIFNKITVVIVDYRLEDSNGNCRQKQGYSFVSWLLKRKRLAEIFVYSGQSRVTVLNTFKKFGIKPNYRRKTEVTGSTVDKFVAEIIEKGNETYCALLNQPNIGYWNFSLKKFYAHFRNHPEYKNLEQQISRKAKHYIKQIDYFHRLNENDDELGWFNTLQKEGRIVPPFREIRKEGLKKKGEYDTPVMPLPYGKPDDNFEAFKKILIVRRIILWLRSQLGIEDNDLVANLIFKGTFSTTKTLDRPNLFSWFCVGENDFPTRILVEEKEWFKSIIHDYEDPQSINDKEKIVYFESGISEVSKLIVENLNLLKNEKQLFGKLQSDYFRYTITKKEGTQPLKVIRQIFDINEFHEYFDYLVQTNDNLQEEESIKKHLSTNNGSLKKSILKNYSQIVNQLVKDANIKYDKALNIFFNVYRGDLIEKLKEYFHIKIEVICQHPYQLINLINILKQFPAFDGNAGLTKIENELSEHINLKHYHGDN